MKEVATVSARARVVDLTKVAKADNGQVGWQPRVRKPAQQLLAKREQLQRLKDKVDKLVENRKDFVSTERPKMVKL